MFNTATLAVKAALAGLDANELRRLANWSRAGLPPPSLALDLARVALLIERRPGGIDRLLEGDRP